MVASLAKSERDKRVEFSLSRQRLWSLPYNFVPRLGEEKRPNRWRLEKRIPPPTYYSTKSLEEATKSLATREENSTIDSSVIICLNYYTCWLLCRDCFISRCGDTCCRQDGGGGGAWATTGRNAADLRVMRAAEGKRVSAGPGTRLKALLIVVVIVVTATSSGGG